MTNSKRHYSIKDVDMIISAATIVESAINNKALLQSKRPAWNDPFFENLRERIETATQDYLGVDNAKALRNATQVILSIQKEALLNLAEVKVQINEDFKDNPTRKTQILIQLGFASYYKGAQNKDQEALINLLYQFKVNLTPTLKQEIIDKGIAVEALDVVAGFADTLKAADITQEVSKGMRSEITATAINEFNAIYDSVISISKISGKFLKHNPALKRQFSFTKVAKMINASKSNPNSTGTE